MLHGVSSGYSRDVAGDEYLKNGFALCVFIASTARRRNTQTLRVVSTEKVERG